MSNLYVHIPTALYELNLITREVQIVVNDIVYRDTLMLEKILKLSNLMSRHPRELRPLLTVVKGKLKKQLNNISLR